MVYTDLKCWKVICDIFMLFWVSWNVSQSLLLLLYSDLFHVENLRQVFQIWSHHSKQTFTRDFQSMSCVVWHTSSLFSFFTTSVLTASFHWDHFWWGFWITSLFGLLDFFTFDRNFAFRLISLLHGWYLFWDFFPLHLMSFNFLVSLKEMSVDCWLMLEFILSN